jgi:hypothetical protein
MAFQQSDLDNIRACIASGVLKTRFADGREVYYQSLEQMLQAEQRIVSALTSASPTARSRIRTPGWRNGC